jgi:CRP/FNR family transcriptional regulator, cyclic AMP receptor protein
MNQIVFSQGHPADSIFFIEQGKVKVTVVSEQGKEAVVAILGPGQFCGEGCLAGQTRRMATATAITETEIMRLEKAAVVRVLHDEPAFSEFFVSHLLARNIRVEENLVDQLFNSSEKRLARALLLLANFGKEGRPEPIIAKISQETLADMVGTTRSRVSFFMNKFRQLGFIEYNGNVVVHSSLLSVVLHDQPQIRSERDASLRKAWTWPKSEKQSSIIAAIALTTSPCGAAVGGSKPLVRNNPIRSFANAILLRIPFQRSLELRRIDGDDLGHADSARGRRQVEQGRDASIGQKR